MNTVLPLTSAAVTAVIKDCLYRDEEINGDETLKGTVFVDGIVKQYGFHPQRLESHRQDVIGFIEELDNGFRWSGGGGQSFLNLSFDKHGNQWGEQYNAEALYCLAAGLKLAKFPLPRSYWSSLPGAVPYVVFHTQEIP